jgi:tRNA pseudouridine65 synthase
MLNTPLDVLYRDADLIAVDKPTGLIVHRSGRSDDGQPALLQMLRDQIGQRVYPIHRLDQPTSGIVLFGLDPTAAAAMVNLFEQHRVLKIYQALVLGFTAAEFPIELPLLDERRSKEKTYINASTAVSTIRWFDVSPPAQAGGSLGLSWIEAFPSTGRWHQIRRHLQSVGHPIVGDFRHGDEPTNLWLQEFARTDTMMLSSVYLEFQHPFLGHRVVIRASRHAIFSQLIEDILPFAVTISAK